MARVLFLLLLACSAASAQRNEMWANPGLTERGVHAGEQQLMLRQDLSACHGTAFDSTRGVEDEQKRKALGIALFKQCMADKGWHASEPKVRKPVPKAPKETAT